MSRIPFKRHVTLLIACILAIGVIVPVATFASAPKVKASSSQTTTLSISALAQWTDTGIDLTKGSSVSISASGTVIVNSDLPYQTPAGDTSCIPSVNYVGAQFPAENLPCWSLIGRIGNGTPFEVGTSLNFSVTTPGRLFLGINDFHTGDNYGSWTVNVTTSTAASAHRKLFVFIQGIDTQLTDKQVNANTDDTFYSDANGLPGIAPFLQKFGYGNAQYLQFSYAGSDGKGNPIPYECVSTFTQPLRTDTVLLGRQIVAALTHNPKLKGQSTDVYIISHSLGGVVALSYVAALYNKSNVSVPALPSGDHLQAVVTLDSPIGGISDNTNYFDLAALLYNRGIGFPFHVCGIPESQLTSVKNLVALFKTTSKPTFPPPDDDTADPQGSHASILEAVLGGVAFTNQGMAEAAATVHGTSILTVGNTRDYLWNPSACTSLSLPGILRVPNVNFLSTQWVEDETGEATVYGREISAGNPICTGKTLLFNGGNHGEVLNNPNVDAGLLQFLPKGAEPTALKIAPPGA